jgi:hypothetical protein
MQFGKDTEDNRRGQEGPLRLRAHHALCLQGFVGLGYSDSFTENMRAVKDALADDSTEVEMTLAPDAICGACPHLATRASCGSPEGTDRDRAVIAALDVAPGDGRPWGWWLARVGERISPDWLESACQECQWFPLGHCLKGIRDLWQTEAAGRAE